MTAGPAAASSVSFPDFPDRFAQARRLGYAAWGDDILEMSDASEGKDMAGVASAKLRADKRCRLLSKLLPEQYGDRVQVEHSGETRVSLYLPDKRRQLPGDNAPIIDGTAQEMNSDESPEMQTNPVRFLNQVADLQSIGNPPRAWW